MKDDQMGSNELTSQRMVDRLIDGELNEADRQSVLRSLDAQPGGWRRCATAFLEHQELASAIPQMAAVGDDTTEVQQQQQTARFAWTGLLALAATAFFAFVLGLQSDSWLRSRDGTPLVADNQGDKPSAQLVNSSPGAQSGIPLEDFLNRESIIPPQFLRELEQSGNLVQKHRGLAAAVRADGRQVLVPYEELEIVPARHMTH